MTRRARRLGGGLATLLALSTAAAHAAELRVDCAGVGDQALREALAAELADHPGARAAELRVTVGCPDEGSAEIVVESAGARRLRVIDLRDVPPELRARLIALAVAEAMALALAPAAPAAPAAPEEPTPAPPPVAPAPAAKPAPRMAAPAPPIVVAAPARAASRFEVVPSLALRAYGPIFRVVPLVAADVGVGRWSFGAHFLSLNARGPTGDVRLSLGAASAGVRVGCAQVSSLRLCLVARADAGVTWADAEPIVRGLGQAHDAAAPYLALTARSVLSIPAEGTGARVLLDLGWAEGLIARSEGDEAARAAGLFVAVGLGVRLW